VCRPYPRDEKERAKEKNKRGLCHVGSKLTKRVKHMRRDCLLKEKVPVQRSSGDDEEYDTSSIAHVDEIKYSRWLRPYMF
jgi:hypothetical protein